MSVTLLFMMGSLIMLVPLANLNIFSNTAMAQGYDNYGDSSSYSNIQQRIKNMSVEQVHLKAFLLVLWNSVNFISLIEKITLEIIEQ